MYDIVIMIAAQFHPYGVSFTHKCMAINEWIVRPWSSHQNLKDAHNLIWPVSNHILPNSRKIYIFIIKWHAVIDWSLFITRNLLKANKKYPES